MKSVIINEPSLQTLRQRYTFSLLTFIFWVLWIYLWLPLVSLFAWMIGIDILYEEMIQQNGFQSLFAQIGWYSLAVLIIACILLGWALYNLKRFQGKERRHFAQVTDNKIIAEYFSVDATQLSQWQQEKRLVVHYDEKGNISSVATKEGQPM